MADRPNSEECQNPICWAELSIMSVKRLSSLAKAIGHSAARIDMLDEFCRWISSLQAMQVENVPRCKAILPAGMAVFYLRGSVYFVIPPRAIIPRVEPYVLPTLLYIGWHYLGMVP